MILTFFSDTNKLEEEVKTVDETPPTNHKDDSVDENAETNYREDSVDYTEKYNTDKSQDYDNYNHIQGMLYKLSQFFSK